MVGVGARSKSLTSLDTKPVNGAFSPARLAFEGRLVGACTLKSGGIFIHSPAPGTI